MSYQKLKSITSYWWPLVIVITWITSQVREGLRKETLTEPVMADGNVDAGGHETTPTTPQEPFRESSAGQGRDISDKSEVSLAEIRFVKAGRACRRSKSADHQIRPDGSTHQKAFNESV